MLREVLFLALAVGTECKPGVTYRAAVVELTSLPTPAVSTQASATALMLQNVARADAFAAKAAAQGAQIVVFSEDYANSGAFVRNGQQQFYAESLPEPGPKSLCGDDEDSSTPVARALACSAKKHGLIIVTGLGDKGPCVKHVSPFTKKPFPCDPRTNMTQFNSQAAFGRDGQLLAKYHKSHLARVWNQEFEEQWAEADVPDVVTFESDFGVKFGMFICNDINFGGPTRALLESGVRDFVFSTFWISSQPWFTAVGIQDGFARGHGVNFLAANADLDGRKSSGSGIWPADPRAEFVQHYNPTLRTSDGWLGVVNVTSPEHVPALPTPVSHPAGAPTIDAFNFFKGSGTNATFAVASPGNRMQLAASVDNVTCSLDSMVSKGTGTYALIAVSGLISGGWYTGACIFVACAGASGEDCTYIPSERIPGGGAVFESASLRISAMRSNTFMPSAICEGGKVPTPRSSLRVREDGHDRVLDLETECALQAFYVDSRAQSEEEPAECPAGTGNASCSQPPPASWKYWKGPSQLPLTDYGKVLV